MRLGLLALFFSRSVLYTKSMKKKIFLFPVATCLFVGLLFTPADAQRFPKFSKFSKTAKSARALNRQRQAMQNLDRIDQQLSTIKNVQTSRDLLNDLKVNCDINRNLLNNLKEQMMPRSPVQMVKSILDSECTAKRDDVENALEKMWRLQDRYGDHDLFAVFARQYYSKNFGAVSPHLHVLFKRVGSLHNRDMELQFIKRLQFLSQNKFVLSHAVFADKPHLMLPKKSFRVRYLSNIGKLTADNFSEGQLVLSIERSMSPNPMEDFPIRHVNGRSVVKIDEKVYPVYGFTAPIGGDIASLYTYLLYDKNIRKPLTAVYDKKGQALALYNDDKTLWLRVSPHEYAEPENLHLHLNELRSVEFTAKNGALFNERVNLNLSIPLSTPAGAPIVSGKDFFFNQLIYKPVELFKKDPNITVKERPIY